MRAESFAAGSTEGNVLSLSPSEAERVRHHVEADIGNMDCFKQASGGSGYWNASEQVNDWATSWGGHFLVEAKRAGYPVPDAMLERWATYQKARARE